MNKTVKVLLIVLIILLSIPILIFLIAFIVGISAYNKDTKQNEKPATCILFEDKLHKSDFDGSDERNIRICQYNENKGVVDYTEFPSNDDKQEIVKIKPGTETISICFKHKIGYTNQPQTDYFREEMIGKSGNGDTIIVVLKDLMGYSPLEEYIKIK